MLGVGRSTLTEFLASNEDARAAWDLALESGKASLKRLMWRTAQKSTTMQFGLSKQLGYTDRVERSDTISTTATANVAILAAPDLEKLNDRTACLRAFEQIQLQLRAAKPPLIDVTPTATADVGVPMDAAA